MTRTPGKSKTESLNTRGPMCGPRRGGYAMLLVMIAIAIAAIVAMEMLGSLTPATTMASNTRGSADAHAVAQGALDAAEAYLAEHADDWTTDNTDKSEGWWATDVTLGDGTYSLYATRTDGDAGDDAEDFEPGDRITFVATATDAGVTAQATRVVETDPAADPLTLLFVKPGTADLSPTSSAGKTAAYFEGLGYTVEYIAATASSSAFDDAATRNMVAYVPEDVSSGDLNTKLYDAPLGVVIEEPYNADDFEIANPPQQYNSDTIVITDNTHSITEGFALGGLVICSTVNEMHRSDGGFAADTKSLAETTSGYPVLLYLDIGDRDRTGATVAGRRLVMPWGWTFHDFDALNADGRTILQRSVEWAAMYGESVGLTANWYNLDASLDELADVDWADIDDTSNEPDINWPSTTDTWRAGIQDDLFALELTGTVTAPSTGTWTFYLDSDDGSDLVIDGATVIDNDGLHGMVELSGAVSMTEGEALPIRVRFFENYGGAGLILSWSGPGTPKQVVPASAFGATETSGDAIAHWPLDETSGTTASDGAGGHHGTLHNGVTTGAAGVVGTAMDFDGGNDHIAIAHSDDLLLDAGTVAFWFRPDDTSGHQAMFSKDTSYYATGGHLHIYLNGSQLRVRLQDTASDHNTQTGSGAISAGNWYHLAFTFGPAGASLYVNGTLTDSDPYTGGLGTTSGGAGNYEPLVLGAGTWSSSQGSKDPVNNYFNGKMDEVYIFNRQLDATEIDALANP